MRDADYYEFVLAIGVFIMVASAGFIYACLVFTVNMPVAAGNTMINIPQNVLLPFSIMGVIFLLIGLKFVLDGLRPRGKA